MRKKQEQSEPRPHVVGFRSVEVQASVLANCRKLKDSAYQKISISPDLTKRQRKEDKETREECNKLNSELTEEERLNWTWKMIGQKGQRKYIKVKVNQNTKRK